MPGAPVCAASEKRPMGGITFGVGMDSSKLFNVTGIGSATGFPQKNSPLSIVEFRAPSVQKIQQPLAPIFEIHHPA
jgi:hypothetical protein